MAELKVVTGEVVEEENGDKSQCVNIVLEMKNGRSTEIYEMTAEKHRHSHMGVYSYGIGITPDWIDLEDFGVVIAALERAREIATQWAAEADAAEGGAE